MRLALGILFLVIIIAMMICTWIARHSGKRIGFAAAGLLAPLILPMAGNGLIILSGNRILSLVGCYLYYLGLDVSIAALIHFTYVYCHISRPRKWVRYTVYPLLLVDVIQLLLNPAFGHAFRIKEIEVEGFPYYQMVPLFGQQFHRAVDYLLLAGIIVVYIYMLVHVPRLQTERYWVILFALVLVSAWETAYIFSGTPIDRSMIGFGVFGLLVFYFALYYRPLRLLDRMLGGVVSDQQDPMYFFDEHQNCIWMNRAGLSFLDLDETELDKAGNLLEKTFGSRHPGEAEWMDQLTLNRNGEKSYIELSKKPLIDSSSKLDGFYILVRDLTEARRETEQKLYNARHDQLTGLFKRDYLFERTRETLAENPDETYLIISAEINDLKMINDLYGNAFGDHALKFAADWLRNNEHLNQGGIFGRMSGDSFGVCVPEKNIDLDRMEQELSNLTITVGETEYRMLIHVGIYRVTDRNLEVSVMYDRANLSMDSIKDDYHYHTSWYDDTLRGVVVRNRKITDELARALAEGQICPWLQPIINREGKTIGAEALVRWIHPEEGVRSPAEFIPVFEKNGMIDHVDRHIWRRACEILARWKQEGRDLFLSINISPKDFYLLDVPAELKQLVREYGVEPARLRLEITETVMMNDPEAQMKILQELREAGFIVEMDDFGSGYSSLNLLREMPVDVLKIDMVFLQKASQNTRARTIVEEVITLASRLGITSLIEGVETEKQYRGLMEMGCELYQGYYFAKPMPLEDFERFAG